MDFSFFINQDSVTAKTSFIKKRLQRHGQNMEYFATAPPECYNKGERAQKYSKKSQKCHVLLRMGKKIYLTQFMSEVAANPSLQ
jgi:hypothetical protein